MPEKYKKMRIAAIRLAKTAHYGQTDKSGENYFEHLRRVAKRVEGDYRVALAYLHDILEDTEISEQEIRIRFGIRMLDDIDRLTRRDGETYAQYISRVAHGTEDARVVKLADLADHLSRSGEISSSLINRYKRAEKVLSKAQVG